MQYHNPRMTRKCSHCNLNGHNSRTCPNRGVKLFGVRLTDGLIRKSASMGNLSHYSGSNSGALLSHNSDSPDHAAAADGYASEDFVPGSSSTSRERKKAGIPWTEEEHRMFLLGLQKLGKGDWRGISRNYVVSRTPTQVASHAQKYFIRQTNMSRRKRRPSLFDIVVDESIDAPMESEDMVPSIHPQAELESSSCPTVPPTVEEECKSMDSSNSNDKDPSFTVLPQNSQARYPVLVPTYVSPSPFFPFSFPYWSAYNTEPSKKESHEVLRPTAVHSKSPINVDELVGMSKLSLAESNVQAGPSSLSLKLEDGSARNSAFHAQPTSRSSAINSSSNPIPAV